MTPLDRIRAVSDMMKNDPKALSLISSVLQSALRYVSAVYTMETTLSLLRLTGSESLKEETSRLDQLRSLAHNSLIDSIRICNRYLFQSYGFDRIPAGGIYSSDPIHLTDNVYRAAIGDWAGDLIASVFSSRPR